ncbi:GH36-type glycosyl hydrolase domain-containing protein [Clostridium amazonitimonense]|uniref:GH36-type glycosyl hydrolase domain-containing protein n=1 Tax=Clostridium amazonitimonense TaxID=1499689 RepID=UPI000509506D|nr:glucoamylase family protein [Clostridium amazonitimonense]
MIYIYLAIFVAIAALFMYPLNLKRDQRREDNTRVNYREDKEDNFKRMSLEELVLNLSEQKIIPNKKIKKKRLMQVLDREYKNIIRNYEQLKKRAKKEKVLIASGEWLLDNIYMIEKEFKTVKYNMPKSYYKYLPIVQEQSSYRNLRVYSIAKALAKYCDNSIDKSTVEEFLIAYEKHKHLSMGELWCLPLMLRMTLIESISKNSFIVNEIHKEKEKGDIIADRIITAYSKDRLKEELDVLMNEDISYSDAFIDRLISWIKDNGLNEEEIFKWIEEKYDISKEEIYLAIRRQSLVESNLQISMGNAIGSLRNIDATDWKKAFEDMSYVEKILSKDPLGIYKTMDFNSRDYYRHKLEKFARIVKCEEGLVAEKVLQCSIDSKSLFDRGEIKEEYKCHVGYYLIDEGVIDLKNSLNYKDSFSEKLKLFTNKYKFSLYSSTIILVVLLFQYLILSSIFRRDPNIQSYKYVLGFILMIIPLSEIVISIFNWSISKLMPPRFVPKIEFKEDIPNNCKTMVVIPTLINNESRAKHLIDDLEIYYLANRHKGLYFAILGDFKDGKNKEEQGDESIINTTLKGIKKLNEKYSQGEDIFYFFNRYRQYNEKEGIWLGWERKRGKLMEFNYLIRGDKNTSYNVISGDINKLQDIKYIITLDADTKLPIGTAKGLIGAMAHILNKPNIDRTLKKVVRGYGLMQPRVTVSIEAASKTFFSKLFSGETGIDTYTTAVSDVYQDIFGEGIFTGKGIYDVDVFNQMLQYAIPENSVLSHDLLEGSYVRCALITDLQLVDGYPAYYNSSILRLHRWVRGDWQLLPWLYKKSPINSLSKWKILDNLRRSLLTPSIILLLLYALTLAPLSFNTFTLVGFIAMICPILFHITDIVITPIKGIGISGTLNSFKKTLEQVILIFSFIPYQAYMMMDAILRTLYRLFISNKNLLQWQTAADVEARAGKRIRDYIKSMIMGSFIGILIGYLAFVNSREAFYTYLPITILWMISPIIAYYISKENVDYRERISSDEELILRNISRRTWAYFEDFINEESSWLAPDNYQEDPLKGVAQRTSPTNIAMAFTSNLSAYDLGYIGIEELMGRMDKSLNAIRNLEKYHGHLYNWYDSTNGKPLYPKYVSTVDSGNLVAYLWMVPEAIKEYCKKTLINEEVIKGLQDTVRLVKEELPDKDIYFKEDIVSYNSIEEYKNTLNVIRNNCIDIEKKEKESYYWNTKLKSMVNKRLKELQNLLPWLDNAIINGGDFNKKLMDTVMNSPLEQLPELLEKLKNAEGCSFECENLIENSIKQINRLLSRMKNLCLKCDKLVKDTDFKVVYNKERGIFYIGYNLEDKKHSDSYYDLLASEARVASYIAIAKGDIDADHWFKLGRSVTKIERNKALVSWSGTMFEYLMPLLMMKVYPDTLWEETYESVVKAQKNYGDNHKIPWGISESAYFHFDSEQNFQYKAFGVPQIGLKRGLEEEMVISPYATVMALMVDIKSSIHNIKSLLNIGMLGRYGLYEAIDYTTERVPKGKKNAIIKSYMVHHQGMSFMALDNVLNKDIFQKRFHNIKEVKSVELLLQEKPVNRIIYGRRDDFSPIDKTNYEKNIIIRRYNNPNTEFPEIQILSNGSYSLMVTNDGSGYGKKEDIMLYRWREDPTTSFGGHYFYIKNLNSNEFWSATYEPCKYQGEDYEAIFSLDKVQYKRRDGNITTKLDITVSKDDNTEIRELTITNNSSSTRYIEITSYMEVALSKYVSDIAHPTFSNLFINTEYIEEDQCLIASRRPRKKGEVNHYVMSKVIVRGETVGPMQYETNRLNFIGRNRSLSNPSVMDNEAPLKNTVGYVLDPILSLRRVIKLKKGDSAQIAFVTSIAESKEELLEISERYNSLRTIDSVFQVSNNQVRAELKQMGIKSNQANLYEVLASKIIFINPSKREREKYLKNIIRSQKNLWSYDISGDYPIVLVKISDEDGFDLVRQVLKAYKYLNKKGIEFDCVIINEEPVSYDEPIQKEIYDIVRNLGLSYKEGKRSGIFIKSKSNMEEEDINLIMAIARFVFYEEKGNFTSQIMENHKEEDSAVKLNNIQYDSKERAINFIRNYNYKDNESVIPNIVSYDSLDKGWNRELEGNKPLKWLKVGFDSEFSAEISKNYRINRELNLNVNKFFDTSNLLFFNGIGGFHPESNAYVICLRNYNNTPAPWINVMANQSFGSYVSESGSSHTWNKNSRENKITPWNNDAVIDSMGEALFLRDDDTGDFWSISPKPVRDEGEYIIEHGFGYSKFSHLAYNIQGEATMFVDINEPIKYQIITVKNQSSETRNLSVMYYARMVLGTSPEESCNYVYTQIEKDFIWARNPYSEHFGNLKTFLKIVGGTDSSFTGNRREFIGKGGALEYPLAIKKQGLSNMAGAGFDPCLSQCTQITLNPGEEKKLVVFLGEHEDIHNIRTILKTMEDVKAVEDKLHQVKSYWEDILGKIKVETPDKSMDIMLNGWLMYQTLCCRYWARTAFYQSGGAYGFRDQLQDSMSIGLLDKNITREQILRSAGRQYLEGDVQHWWHPVINSGIRTRFSDDLLWLPFVTADYINHTGDISILDERIPYLKDEPLKDGEDERYNVVTSCDKDGTIYEHCLKAIDRGLNFGPHNIPLMGSGDWNDGFSTVGNKGTGESVWLGWFLYNILDNFIEICAIKKDDTTKKKYEESKVFIRENLEKNAWDGGWYRRAYFDDGTPLGSIENRECRIDSISQSWAIISGASDLNRAEKAMEAVEKNLIREDKGMIVLLSPPFNNSNLEPGYIKGYVPGVRENGGQYTHAAVWVIMAMAKLGYSHNAWRLFNMINPINHSSSIMSAETYKTEPYVMAADVYSLEPYEGRGGWSWYTGAAGWMYKVAIENILGLKIIKGEGFTVVPCIPQEWNEYKITYKREKEVYNIHILRGEEKKVLIDYMVVPEGFINFKEGEHNIKVYI